MGSGCMREELGLHVCIASVCVCVAGSAVMLMSVTKTLRKNLCDML